MSNIMGDDIKKRLEMLGDKSAVENMFDGGQPAVLGEFSNRCEIEISKDGEAIVYPVINGENPVVTERGIAIEVGHSVVSFPIAAYGALQCSPADIGRGNINTSFQNFGTTEELTDYTYQDETGKKAVPFVPTSYSLRKFSDDELRENIMTMNHAITKDAVIEEKAKLRDHSYSFMLAKDKNKIDFKIYINSIFKKDEKDIKNKFVKDLYSTKILYKEFKHLNFAAKRLVVNNRLRANIIDYCSNTESAANDILVLLENDSSNFDYLFKHLQPAIRKMIDRGIAL